MIRFERELGLVLLFPPSPWKPCTLDMLCVPFCHLQDARHVNFVAPGASFSASRAASNASTLTPLLTFDSAIVEPPR